MPPSLAEPGDPRGGFTVGLVQMACQPDPTANRDAACAGIHSAAARGANVICLPELFASQYFCQQEDPARFDLAETIPGPSTEACARAARELGVVVVAPVFEKRTSGLYHNTAVVIDTTGEIVGRYRKLHIPDDPQYYEKFYFTPGDLGYRVFNTSVARIGVLICWDQWFPEAARLTALQGADILVYPTAIGWLAADRDTEGPAQVDAWQTIQRSHAIANGLYVAAVNRVGHEGPSGSGIDFWGQSFVCDPRGQVLEQASGAAAQVVVTRCDRALVEQQRRHWPFLRDRRLDTYGPLVERFLDEHESS